MATDSLLAAGVRPFADIGQNPVFERFYQGFGMTSGPREMQEVVGVKVQVIELVIPTGEYHGYVQPLRESHFVVHGAADAAIAVGEVRYHEPGTAYFSNDLVVDFAQKVRFLVYT